MKHHMGTCTDLVFARRITIETSFTIKRLKTLHVSMGVLHDLQASAETQEEYEAVHLALERVRNEIGSLNETLALTRASA